MMLNLVLDAHEMGQKAWMERGKTQEGLKEWAAVVRLKQGLCGAKSKPRTSRKVRNRRNVSHLSCYFGLSWF
jgi:hypothetical protein